MTITKLDNIYDTKHFYNYGSYVVFLCALLTMFWLKWIVDIFYILFIWLELTRTYIPIRRMSPKRLHSRTSHALSVNRNCMFFLRLVRNCHWKDDIKNII